MSINLKFKADHNKTDLTIYMIFTFESLCLWFPPFFWFPHSFVEIKNSLNKTWFKRICYSQRAQLIEPNEFNPIDHDSWFMIIRCSYYVESIYIVCNLCDVHLKMNAL